jgi:hypothetical protein
VKPGVKSTEFWAVVLMVILAAAAEFSNTVHSELALKVGAASVGLYAILRFVLKLGGQGDAVAQADALRDVLREAATMAATKRATPNEPVAQPTGDAR